MGPGAFFDLPWLPFYLAICFAFHVLIGVTALIGAIILVTLTVLTEFLSRRPAREAMGLASRRNDLAASSRRNAEVLVAMGMSGRLGKRWSEANQDYLEGNQRASDVAGGLGAVAKVLRMQKQHLDPNNVALGVLNPLGTGQGIRNQDLAGAICGAINDWQIEKWTSQDSRLKGSIVVANEDGLAAAAEVRKRAGDANFVQVLLLSRNVEPLGQRRYWPIYEAAQEAGLPIGVHVDAKHSRKP